MGRCPTGVIRTNEAKRIELRYLLRNNLIQKDKIIFGSLNWTDGSNINFETFYSKDEAYLRVNYKNTNVYTGEVTEHDYKIYLTSVPSNLGKGEVLYMVCPITGKRSRILYKCYGSLIWKSREAYQNWIYYDSQLLSKKIRPFKFMFYEKELEELYRKKVKSHYRGKPTRLMKRIERLERNMNSFHNDPYFIEKMLLS